MPKSRTEGTQGQERSFGLSLAVACGLTAGFWFWRGKGGAAAVLGIVAVSVLVPALVRPTLLRTPRRLWMGFAQRLGWVNSRLLLSVFYMVVLTPIGLLLRLTGWDPLRLKRQNVKSHWLPYPDRIRDPRHYERPY